MLEDRTIVFIQVFSRFIIKEWNIVGVVNIISQKKIPVNKYISFYNYNNTKP